MAPRWPSTAGAVGRRGWAARALIAVGTATVAGIEPREPTRLDVPIGRGSGRPLRSAQLSDLQLRDDPALNKRIATVAARTRADILAFTGDVIDSPDRLEALSAFLEAIAAAGNRAPNYAVTGNWEYWSHTDDRLSQTYTAHHVQWLRDRSVRVTVAGRDLDLLGLDDGAAPRIHLPDGILPPDEGRPLLILAHFPSTLDGVAASLPDRSTRPLALLGHTHGGQVALLGLAPVLPPGSRIQGHRVVEGAVQAGVVDGYISPGVGTSIIDLRWGVPPQIPVLEWTP
ncbi:MAG: hypothetical protein EXR69_09760 [Myxococcales bacterium]|nr:hypothetical protein [Myxococcales bacterium]